MNVEIGQVLAQVDLIALAEEAGAQFGRGDSSPCPLHGGDNRTAFHVYVGQDGRQRWHCFTNCPEGTNGGDALAFYMQWQGVDFRVALGALALRAGVTGDDVAPVAAKRKRIVEEVEPVVGWSTRAMEFVMYAEDQLWGDDGSVARGFLMVKRGLGEDAMRRWRLGYNPRDVWDKPQRWGLGGGRKIWLPSGIVIPGLRKGLPWYVKVRRPLPGGCLALAIGAVKRLETVKFSGPRGGRMTLFGGDELNGLPVVLLCEGEWDAMLAHQEAGDLCGVVSLGGTKHRLDEADRLMLAGAWVVLAVYDRDKAGRDGAAARMAEMGTRMRTVDSPAEDLTEFWLDGGDLRSWIAGQVAGAMELILPKVNERRYAERFTEFLALYERAMRAR